jgi:hypothetical protein
LPTNSDLEIYIMVTRRTGKGREEIGIPCPKAIMNYTVSMGGDDLADQERILWNWKDI